MALARTSLAHMGGAPVDAAALVESALLAGVIAGSKDVASAAVKDTYEGLRDRLRRRMTGSPTGEAALDEHQREPEIWRDRLLTALNESGASTDEQILSSARELLSLLDPAGTAKGKYAVDLREAKGIQVGDGNVQHNSFS